MAFDNFFAGIAIFWAVPTQNLRLLNEFPSRVEHFAVKVFDGQKTLRQPPVKIDWSEYLPKLFDQTQP